MRTSILLTALVALAAPALAGCGGEDDPAGASASTPGEVATSADAPAGTSSAGDGECRDVAQPAPKTIDMDKPTGSLDRDKTYLVDLETSCGTIVIELDQRRHPKTANAVAAMVREGVYDDTAFHRVVPGFVIQGGDPSGTGGGGPDWQVVEAPPSDQQYPRGTVAMAKTGQDPEGAVGSQFFIMLGDGLDPQYAVAGKVVEGMDVADAIAQRATGPDGPPAIPIVVEDATLETE